MDKNSAEWIVLDYLCEKFDKHAYEKKCPETEILFERNKANTSRGDIVSAIQILLSKKYIEKSMGKINYANGNSGIVVVYNATAEGYQLWKNCENETKLNILAKKNLKFFAGLCSWKNFMKLSAIIVTIAAIIAILGTFGFF